MTRTLIRTMSFPDAADPKALADRIADTLRVSSIVGSGGEVEVRFVEPDDLVVVIGPNGARFYDEPVLLEEEVDPDHAPPEPEDPDSAAESVAALIARVLGLRDPAGVEGEDAEDEGPPPDESDRHAKRVVAALLDRGLIELVSPRSRASVEAHVAHVLAHHGADPQRLSEEIIEHRAVADLYADDEALAAILDAALRPPAAKKTRPRG